MANASVEPLILAIDTATTAGGGVAISRGARLLACRTWSGSNASHSTSVLQEVDALLGEVKISLGAVQLFAALVGPGSFTGLRIGLATVKSLAATLARPCAGVPTLGAVARAAGPSACTLACLPAGRGEVFWQLLGVAEDLIVTPLSEPTHHNLETLFEHCLALEVPLLWAGSAIDVYGARIIEFAREKQIATCRKNMNDAATLTRRGDGARRAWVIDDQVQLLAVEAGALAWCDFRAGHVCDAEALRATYVRRVEAEVRAIPHEKLNQSMNQSTRS